MQWASGCAVIGLAALAIAVPNASATEPDRITPVHVAAYDSAPYAARDANGLFWGASVDLWRRVAEDRHWNYDLTLVASIEDVIDGVAAGRFDVAIGAITITPDRLARVSFTYPSHRSGVAVAMVRRSGRLGVLIALTLGLLFVTGVLIWLFERRWNKAQASETSIGTVFEGLYWAVVTMTTVGYGDKTPRTHSGRAIAVAWMMGSLVLISLLSTSLVAQLTADQIDDARPVALHDLAGMRLAAAASSSGAEFLAGSDVAFHPYPSLDAALSALAAQRADAVINSVGTLEWAVASGYRGTIEVRTGLLASSLMGFAIPPGSPLLVPLDESLVRATSSADWPKREASYFTQ
jgi:ABC-type amino acid transport substrate-binding protein